MKDNTVSVKKTEDSYDWNQFSMLLGSLVMVVNGLALVIWDNLDGVWAGSLMLGLAVFLPYFFTYIGLQKRLKDERARKIGTAAAAYSWYATFLVLSMTGILGFFLDLDIGMARFLGIAIITMVLTMLASNLVLNRKGDIE